jgi:hypothetical protein
MAAETKKEIGHVLFIDIVGYFKLPIPEQQVLSFFETSSLRFRPIIVA